MLTPNHPNDERLAALASADADALDDAELTAHVATCARCTETVTELGALRASLAELPDLRPVRPLRLLPGVEPGVDGSDGPPDRMTGWVRRLFGPVMTVGATLALVGLVGTTVPTLSGGADAGDTSAEQPVAAPAGEEAAGGAPSSEVDQPLGTLDSGGGYEAGADGDGEISQLQSSGVDGRAVAGGAEEDDTEALTGLPAERSPWPMVLFGGVALVIVALLLRWIVVPRAG